MANSSVFRVKVDDQWVDIPAVQGTDGVSVDVRMSGSEFQEKRSDEDTWTTIFDFSTIETIKGDKGDTGVGISSVSLSSSGSSYVLTFTMTDATTRQVSFPKPSNGTNGYTPVRGTDYWTAADIQSMHDYIDQQILGGAW